MKVEDIMKDWGDLWTDISLIIKKIREHRFKVPIKKSHQRSKYGK